jgi:hypothetical protein
LGTALLLTLTVGVCLGGSTFAQQNVSHHANTTLGTTIERTLDNNAVDILAGAMGYKVTDTKFKQILAIYVLVLGVDGTNKLAHETDEKIIKEIQTTMEQKIDLFLEYRFIKLNSDKEDRKRNWAFLVDWLHGVLVNGLYLACEYKTYEFNNYIEKLRNADDNFIRVYLKRAKEKDAYKMSEFVMDTIFVTGASQIDGTPRNSLIKQSIPKSAFSDDIERSKQIYRKLVNADILDYQGFFSVKLKEVESKVNGIDLSHEEKAHVLSILLQSIKYDGVVFLDTANKFTEYVQVNRDYTFISHEDQ